MQARNIMTPNPSVVRPGDTVIQAAEIMRELDVGMVPVVGGWVDGKDIMRLVGVITDRDLATRVVAAGLDPAACRVRTCMTAAPLATVGPDASVPQVIATMERAQVRRLPVVVHDRLVGIIAQADLAVKLGPREPAVVEHMLERLSHHPGA